MERREEWFVNTSYSSNVPSQTVVMYPAKQGGSSSERIMREKRLYEASLSGNVESLNQLMEEDRLTLARVSVTCFDETPLHIASMLGHLEFAKAVLGYKPDMAKELDSKGQSPLHLSSANGYIEIVKILLHLDPQVCLVRDEDGRTPLHLAAMKGRADIVEELVRAGPEVTGYRLGRGETLLHLCVVHNRLEALMLLVEQSRIEDGVNAKDGDGNTILHIATTLKHLETIKFLLRRTGVQVNAVNGNGTTALDIIEHTPRDLKTMEIRELLVKSSGLRSKNIPASALSASNDDDNNSNISREDENDEHQPPLRPHPPSRSKSFFAKRMKKQDNWLKDNRDSLMLAATLIAAMAFQSGLDPPGGFWDEDQTDPEDKNKIKYYAGTSILYANFPDGYPKFWIYNTLSFISSLSIVLLVVSGLPLKKRIFIWILMAAMWVTISSVILTYLNTMLAISPGDTLENVLKVSTFGWLVLVGIVFLCHTIRFILWIIRKVRKFRKNRLVNQTREQV